jgi:hypothetical protein
MTSRTSNVLPSNAAATAEARRRAAAEAGAEGG